jgi:hypothetical protein
MELQASLRRGFFIGIGFVTGNFAGRSARAIQQE